MIYQSCLNTENIIEVLLYQLDCLIRYTINYQQKMNRTIQ